ncbi:zinc finger protein 518A [Discoglossus pictus]
MKSPMKDLPVGDGESTPLTEHVGDYSDTSDPNIGLSLFQNDRISHEMDSTFEMAKGTVDEEIHINKNDESLQNPPCKRPTARKTLGRGNISVFGTYEKLNTDTKSERSLDDDSQNISAKVLHFFCQKCKNGIRYSPNDLQKHFQISHNGELPLYPCEMCNFSTSYFQEFKQHRKTHRSTLVKCEICNNDYLYTLLDLTKHFSTMHCVDGHFNCSKCKFSTRDVGTCVQHIHRHNGIEYACQKCNHVSFSKIDFQRHLQGHSALFPFSCKYCNYSAMRKDFIVKHVLARHKEHVQTKEEFDEETCETQMVQTISGLKLVLKRNQTETPSQSPWRPESHDNIRERAGEGTPNQGGSQLRSSDPHQTRKSLASSNTSIIKDMQDGTPVTNIKCNKEDSSVNLLKNAVQGPTVLMVKNNKINVPANYTATFMGYRMVDGKQNIVIKLLPTNKQNALQKPSPSSSTSTPQSHGSSSTQSNYVESGSSNFFKSSLSSSTSVASVERQKVSVWNTGPSATNTPSISRKNMSPISMKAGGMTSQQYLESIQTDLKYRGMRKSSFSPDFTRSIKQEPEEYSVSDLQNDKHLSSDHNYQTANSQVYPSRSSHSGSSSSKMDPLFMDRRVVDHRGLRPSETFLSKELNELRNSKFFPSNANRRPGNFPCTNTNLNLKSQNDFAERDVRMGDQQLKLLEDGNGCDNSFMPKITSVFSLQIQPSNSTSVEKNKSAQENENVNNLSKMSNSQSSNAFAFKQPTTNMTLKSDSHIANGDRSLRSNVANTAMFIKQEPESSGYFYNTNTNAAKISFAKTFSDVIVTRQLAKDKLLGTTKTSSAPTIQLLKNPQPSNVSQANTVLYPSSSNQILFPVVPTSQSGFKMVSPSSGANNPPIRGNAPVVMNAKPGMVLTFSNGPLGAIRNITSGGSHVMGTINSQGKLPLPRLYRPALPRPLLPDITRSLSANMTSGSTAGNSIPFNLNLLQYCVNSDSSGKQTGNLESVNHLNKQPIYALLPDGKQAVLLNYVLPNSSTLNSQQISQAKGSNLAITPKNIEAAQGAFRANSAISIKVEEDDTLIEKNTARNISRNSYHQGNLIEQKSLRSRSIITSSEQAYSRTTNRMSSASIGESKAQTDIKYNQNLFTTWSKRNKRKASVDSSSSRTESENKNKATKKNPNDYLQEPPRKKMLHRKCKDKSYTSEVSDGDLTRPRPSKDTVRTLRLYPYSSNQLVKYPRQNQPVVVLNHPDADVPEVVNVMKTISKFSGHILKVSLSKRTIDALLESRLTSSDEMYSDDFSGRRLRRSKPVSPVKERFVLKLTLKKTSKNNYKIVKNTSGNQYKTKFNCWFCGRIFDNQDEWVGHGQRHLMEATKDWNTLY